MDDIPISVPAKLVRLMDQLNGATLLLVGCLSHGHANVYWVPTRQMLAILAESCCSAPSFMTRSNIRFFHVLFEYPTAGLTKF